MLPVIKNKTSDIADKHNYTANSFAAISGKVFDDLDRRLRHTHV